MRLIDLKKLRNFKTRTAELIMTLVTELDAHEQVQRIHQKKSAKFECDRVIYNAAANAYSHAFDIVCRVFDIESDKNLDGTKKEIMKKKLYKNKEWLEKMLYVKHYKSKEIAEICKVSPATINNYINKFGLRREE